MSNQKLKHFKIENYNFYLKSDPSTGFLQFCTKDGNELNLGSFTTVEEAKKFAPKIIAKDTVKKEKKA